MKNQGENKNRNKFDSHMFMHFIADLIEIGPFYFLCILMSNIYIYILYIYIHYIYIYILYYIYYIYRALHKNFDTMMF